MHCLIFLQTFNFLNWKLIVGILMDYTLHDEKTIQEMLQVIGINSLDDLYTDIPEDMNLQGLNLEEDYPNPTY